MRQFLIILHFLYFLHFETSAQMKTRADLILMMQKFILSIKISMLEMLLRSGMENSLRLAKRMTFLPNSQALKIMMPG